MSILLALLMMFSSIFNATIPTTVEATPAYIGDAVAQDGNGCTKDGVTMTITIDGDPGSGRYAYMVEQADKLVKSACK